MSSKDFRRDRHQLNEIHHHTGDSCEETRKPRHPFGTTNTMKMTCGDFRTFRTVCIFCSLGGFLFGAVGATQACPIHIGAHVFAAHGAASGALNVWAAFCRDTAALPVGDDLGADTKRFGQRPDASQDVSGLFNWRHAATLHAAFSFCKRSVYLSCV